MRPGNKISPSTIIILFNTLNRIHYFINVFTCFLLCFKGQVHHLHPQPVLLSTPLSHLQPPLARLHTARLPPLPPAPVAYLAAAPPPLVTSTLLLRHAARLLVAAQRHQPVLNAADPDRIPAAATVPGSASLPSTASVTPAATPSSGEQLLRDMKTLTATERQTRRI